MSSPTQPDPWIGRLLGDRQRYRLETRLGGGGMGDVFLAMDTLLGQQVALKLIKDALVVTEELRKRFEREVALCAALKSDHIVEVLNYGETPEGHPFYVMEYLRGQSLGQLLRQNKRLTVERTVSIMTQVCDGLQLAHEGVVLWRDGATVSEHVQVVHRDLKPDNIFLVPTTLGELVKILDFGIAKIRSADYTITKTATILGTFRYAAPEQLGAETNLDRRADIYSLGIILYEMLSGSDPFGFGIKTRSTTGMSWVMAHTSKPPQPLRQQPGLEQLSPQLEAVVMRCLQKSPTERFASVDELNRALQAAAAGESSGKNITYSGQGVPETTISTQTHIPPKLLSPLRILIAIGFTGIGIIIYAYFRLQLQVLNDIKALKIKGKYENCITKAQTVTQYSPIYNDTQRFLNECRLEYAKKLALDQYAEDAVAEARNIPKNSHVYPQAKVLIERWLKRIIW